MEIHARAKVNKAGKPQLFLQSSKPIIHFDILDLSTSFQWRRNRDGQRIFMKAPHWFKRLKFSQKLKPQKILTEIERKDRRSCWSWFEDLVYWQHPSWSLRGLHTRHSSQISVVKRSCWQAWAKFHRDSTRVFYLNLVQVHHENKKLHDDFRFCEHYFVTWYGISETTWTKKYYYRSLGAFVPLNCKRSIHFYARRPLKCTVQHACYPTRIYFWPGPKKWHSGYPATSRAALRIGEHPTTVLRIRGVIRQRRGMPLRIRGAIRPPRCRWGYEGPSDMSATWSAVEDTRGYAPKKTQPCHSRRIKHASLSSFCYGNLATKEEDQFVIHQTIFWTQRQQAHPLRGFGKLLIWSLSAEDMEFLSANPRCWPILLRISVLLRSVENWVLSSFNDKLLCLSFGLFKRPTAAYNNHGIVKGTPQGLREQLWSSVSLGFNICGDFYLSNRSEAFINISCP